MTTDDPAGDEAAPDTGGLSRSFGEDEPSDLESVLSQLTSVVEQLEQEEETAAETTIEGSAAQRAVVVRLTGGLEAVSVRIDPSLVDPRDVETLEDAVLAALRDALEQVRELRQEVSDDIEEGELGLAQMLDRLRSLPGMSAFGIPEFGELIDPGQLLASLTGALGELPGGLGGALGAGFPQLGDLLAGVGLSSEPSSPDEDSDADDTTATDEDAESE